MPTQKFTPKRIRTLRAKMGMTQAEFAIAVGVSWGTVLRWENGHYRPSKHVLPNLERVAASVA